MDQCVGAHWKAHRSKDSCTLDNDLLHQAVTSLNAWGQTMNELQRMCRCSTPKVVLKACVRCATMKTALQSCKPLHASCLSYPFHVQGISPSNSFCLALHRIKLSLPFLCTSPLRAATGRSVLHLSLRGRASNRSLCPFCVPTF